MKKTDCIAKYGEEVWEKWKSQTREWRKAHKQKISEYGKSWADKNKEKTKGYKDKYYTANKEEVILKNKERYQTPIGNAEKKLWMYNCADKERGLDISNNITSKWIVENIFSGQKCVYCGDQDWTHLGCDRIDNSKPHTADNVVCSCGLCNIEKNDNYSVEEFKQYRSLHPRACDIPKAPAIQLSETGALKKRAVQIG